MQVLMTIPQSACIVVDYEHGLCIPNLPWPRLRKGLQQQQDHPWDILQVLLSAPAAAMSPNHKMLLSLLPLLPPCSGCAAGAIPVPSALTHDMSVVDRHWRCWMRWRVTRATSGSSIQRRCCLGQRF